MVGFQIEITSDIHPVGTYNKKGTVPHRICFLLSNAEKCFYTSHCKALPLS